MSRRGVGRALAMAAAVAAVPLGLVALLYYYFMAMMGGAFSVPALYSIRLAVPGGGDVVVDGIGETSFRSKGSYWRARYVPPDPGRSEEIGTWFGRWSQLRTAAPSGRVALVAMRDRVFVRTRAGAWQGFDVRFPTVWPQAGIHAGDLGALAAGLGWAPGAPLPTAALVHFAADREELVLDLRTPGGMVAGRLFFRLSPDGARLDLVATQRPGTVAGPRETGG